MTDKLRKQLHISGLNMMSDCQVRFEFRYLKGIKFPPSAYIHSGSATHESVGGNLQHKIDTEELLPRADALGIAEAKFDELKEKDPVDLQDDEKGRSLADVLGEAKDRALNLSGLHYDKVAPGLAPSAVEREFSINMDSFLRTRAKQLHTEADQVADAGTARLLHQQASKLNAAARDGLDFCGKIDIQERRRLNPFHPEFLTSVDDTKTSKRSPSSDVADDSTQLSGYALAAKVLDGRLPDTVRLDYLVETPARHDLKYVPRESKRTTEDINMFLNRFANAVQAIRTGMFVPTNPNNWQCSKEYCGYWHLCCYARRPTLIQINKGTPK